MIHDASGHCWRNAERLINSRKVVPHERQIQKVDMILDFLGMSIG
jgi:hypothetical protein